MRYDHTYFIRTPEEIRSYSIRDTIQEKLALAIQYKDSYNTLQFEYGRLNVMHARMQDQYQHARAAEVEVKMDCLVNLIRLEWYQYQDAMVEYSTAICASLC
jgi:hypothetical protein